MRWIGELCVAVLCGAAQGQVLSVERVEDRGSWPSDLDAPAFSVPGARPERGGLAVVDHAGLTQRLAEAPNEIVGGDLLAYGLAIDLPNPEGGLTRCRVASSPVMAPALAARYPSIRTYIVAAEDRSAVGRLDVSPRGLSAMLRVLSDPESRRGMLASDLSGGTWMIDPWRSGDPTRLVAYRAGEVPGSDDWTCHTVSPEGRDPAAAAPAGFGERALQNLETFRLAVACVGEYGLYHSTIQGNPPNVSDPLAAIVTVVNRSNAVFEQDLGVRFLLVANNDRVVYVDPATDPFSATCDGSGGSDCSFTVLDQLDSVLRSRLGSGTYDTGHALTRVAGGVAYLRAACNGGIGVSGTPRGGDVDPFAPNVVIHELGHQLGANHTFSGIRGRCGNNANLSTAWEAGSGSSPMAYAGACPVGDEPPSDNVVRFADPFFHSGSVAEMQAYLASSQASCTQVTTSSNSIPEITSTTPDGPIPPGTPFELTLEANDVDGDAFTVSWEQADNGVRRSLDDPDTGFGSLFRIFPPVASPTRVFPRLSDVLASVRTPGERLPTVVGSTRSFRAIVRDNRPGIGSAVISRTVLLNLPSGATPFTLTSPLEGTLQTAGPVTLTWQRGTTHLAPFSDATVRIKLSTDGGLSFPTTLATLANTGSGTVTLPTLTAPDARLRLEPTTGIYFTVSRPFRLVTCPADANADGFLDFFDYDEFVAAFETGLPLADFNRDGFLDFFDYDAFVVAFEAGC